MVIRCDIEKCLIIIFDLSRQQILMNGLGKLQKVATVWGL